MKIFLSFKSEDMKEVEKVVDRLRELSPDVKVSILRQNRKWKRMTLDFLKDSDMVIYLAGEHYSDNIDWEINEAKKIGHKVFCLKLRDDIELNDERLKILDDYDSKLTLKVEPVSFEKIADLVKGDREHLHNKLFETGVIDNKTLVEQYRMLLSTSESLIERRQKLTTTYLTIFSALLPVLTFMLSQKMAFMNIGCAIISLISILLCFSWRNAIDSYGKSNAAKFAILEEMEKQFPASMFASEWVVLKKTTSRYRSYTSRETLIPLLFVAVYALFMVVSIILCFV
ncbi:MAG: hypothetical protein VB091_07000 [Christensenella sp.]|nr:hypothetical protein [Christensenella sp.]